MLRAKYHTQCALCLFATYHVFSFYMLRVWNVVLTVGVVASGTSSIKGQAATKTGA